MFLLKCLDDTNCRIIYRVCSINICDFRDGQRHDIWLSLQKIKLGRLHLAITVTENNEKVHFSSIKEKSAKFGHTVIYIPGN